MSQNTLQALCSRIGNVLSTSTHLLIYIAANGLSRINNDYYGDQLQYLTLEEFIPLVGGQAINVTVANECHAEALPIIADEYEFRSSGSIWSSIVSRVITIKKS